MTALSPITSRDLAQPLQDTLPPVGRDLQNYLNSLPSFDLIKRERVGYVLLQIGQLHHALKDFKTYPVPRLVYSGKLIPDECPQEHRDSLVAVHLKTGKLIPTYFKLIQSHRILPNQSFSSFLPPLLSKRIELINLRLVKINALHALQIYKIAFANIPEARKVVMTFAVEALITSSKEGLALEREIRKLETAEIKEVSA